MPIVKTRFPAKLSLADLTSKIGFTINGVDMGDKNGWSVRFARDVNGDGIDDFMIGAPGANSGAGVTYVVFGAHNLSSSGTLALANLDGQNGFNITGIYPNDESGTSVSAAGDVNADGIDDLIIGAPEAGVSYVVFGARNIGHSGTLALASLNGQNGFNITLSNVHYHTGWSVSATGDVNGDGIADFIIGAPVSFDSVHEGASYLVFGAHNLGSSGTLVLDNLNGQNGFSIPGMKEYALSGSSVSAAGDVNADGITDFMIANRDTGASYVVFGAHHLGSSGTLALASLNGQNGFSITGSQYDLSGYSVSAAGDVNGDGIADVIIGTFIANSQAGVTYVVFGARNIGSSGTLALASLNGQNGFSITEVTPNDQSGYSVSAAGDVNGDGIDDFMIGAPGANNGAGVTYVVFGARNLGSSGTLALASLNGQNGFSISGTHSYDQSSYSVSAAGDVNGDGITDLMIGAPNANSGVGVTYVVFGEAVSYLVANTLTINQGETVLLNNSYFNATYFNATYDARIRFHVNNILHGYFSYTYAPSQAIVSFLQQELINKSVQFTHDGDVFAPMFSTQIGYGGLAVMIPQWAHISSTLPKTPILSSEFPVALRLSALTPKTGFNLIGIYQDIIGGSNAWSVSAAGDVNGDGMLDFIVGEPNANDSTGVIYVVFGARNLGSSGTLAPFNLNGQNGFNITGIHPGDTSGSSVSAIGDVNGDGFADFIIGAPGANSQAGVTYVVFGARNIGSSGTLALASLNGQNGFRLNGNTENDQSGYSVSAAGDVNGDGLADFMIGAPGVNGRTGVTYVVFGARNLGSLSTLALASLNGQNGFSITGVSPNDGSGLSVCAAGDVNGDGRADLMIGSFTANSQTGVTYVVFGAHNIGSAGTLGLASLNGQNGFSLTGVSPNEQSSFSISAAGDVNADGIADLIIGAPLANNFAGAIYVVFGARNLGSSGTLGLAILNGQNGFTITGSPETESGYSLSIAGDVNGDGLADFMIGAPAANDGAGVTYVVFGARNLGSSGTLSLASLNGQNGFCLTGNTPNDQSGYSVSAAGDVNGDGLADFMIGAPAANGRTGVTYVVFGDSILWLMSNRLTVIKGQTILLNSNDVSASYPVRLDLNPIISYAVTNIQHGYLTYIANPLGSISSFQQQDLLNGKIQFTHDGSGNPPTFNIQLLGDGGLASMSPQPASITFVHQGGKLIQNTLVIDQGKKVKISLQNLNAINLDNPADNSGLIFLITELQHGYFQYASNAGVNISHFTQAEVKSSVVEFVHDNMAHAPSYCVTVNDGTMLSNPNPPQRADIAFFLTPVLVNNSLVIAQDERLVLTNKQLSAWDPNFTSADLIFTIQNPQGGYFALTNVTNTSVSIFSQADIQRSLVAFVQNTPSPPSYAVILSNGRVTLAPNYSQVIFHPLPHLINNSLTITQGQRRILSPENLAATEQSVVKGELIFSASDIQHGHFEMIERPGEAITFFEQQRVIYNTIQFVTDGGSIAPSYFISVNDSVLSTQPAKAQINFEINDNNSTSTNTNNQRNMIIGGTVGGISGAIIILLMLRKVIDCYVKKYQNTELTEDEMDLLDFKETVAPIVTHIFDHFKTTGFLGFRSNTDTKAYREAIESLVAQLRDVGVDVKEEMDSPEERICFFYSISAAIKTCILKQSSYVASFFKPDITPDQLTENARKIAIEVKRLQAHKSENDFGRGAIA